MTSPKLKWVALLATAALVAGSALEELGLVAEQPWIEFLSQADAGTQVLLALSVIVLAPLGEEVFFRLYLFRRLSQKGNRKLAYILSTGLFTALHGFAQGAPAYALYGVLLAWGFEKTRSFVVPLGVHVSINTVGMTLLLLST